MINDEKKLDILFSEWKYLQDSSAWNFDNIEKQRNYGFIFVAAVFGITQASPLDQQSHLWVLIPPIVMILLARITTQLEFINVRLGRIVDIEHQVSVMCGTSDMLTTESRFSSDSQSTSVYVITYIYIYLFFYSVLTYGLYRSFEVLSKNSTWISWVYLLVFSFTIVYLVYLHVTYTIRRLRRRREVIQRANKAMQQSGGSAGC